MVAVDVLFAGSDAGGESAESVYTLIATAKLNGLDPELYHRQVLDRIADHTNQPHPGTTAMESLH